jgi:hypothetical protein
MAIKLCKAEYSSEVKVISTNLKTVAYASNCKELKITFKDDSSYIYLDVPVSVYSELLKINEKKKKDPESTDKRKSIGTYFTKSIESKFKVKRGN